MKRQLLIFIVLGLLGFAAGAAAQDVTPTPMPVPTPIPSTTPVVVDKQNVQPEDIKGVPQIAPNYSSDDRSLPDLGRVGVDMTEQKPLGLREAIALALGTHLIRCLELRFVSFHLVQDPALVLRFGHSTTTSSGRSFESMFLSPSRRMFTSLSDS